MKNNSFFHYNIYYFLVIIIITFVIVSITNDINIKNTERLEYKIDSICKIKDTIYINQSSDFEPAIVKAMAYVESRHNPKAVSKNKKYVGYLQISEVYVDHINKKANCNFKYEDRLDKYKSIEMFKIMCSINKLDYNNPNDWECITRRHAGGGNGCNDSITLNYWYKVKKYINE